MTRYLILLTWLISFNAFSFGNEFVGNTSSVCVTPAITAGAYSAGDAIGGQMDFDLALGREKKSGLVRSVTITDTGSTKTPMWIFCFDQDFTEVADNAAVSYPINDISHVFLVVSVTAESWVELGGGDVAQVQGLDKAVKSTDELLRCQIETISAPTFELDNDITVCIDIQKDSQ